MKKNIKTTVMNTASAVDVAAAQPQAAVDGAASVTPAYQAVVGLDVGDRQSHYCVLDLDGEVVAEGAEGDGGVVTSTVRGEGADAHRPGSGHALAVDQSTVDRARP